MLFSDDFEDALDQDHNNNDAGSPPWLQPTLHDVLFRTTKWDLQHPKSKEIHFLIGNYKKRLFIYFNFTNNCILARKKNNSEN